MKKIEFATVILLCLAIIAAFGACGGSPEETAIINPTEEDSANGDETPADPHAPSLPDTNMNGKIFTVLVAGWGEGSERTTIQDIAVAEGDRQGYFRNRKPLNFR